MNCLLEYRLEWLIVSLDSDFVSPIEVHLPLDWLIGTLIESGSSVHTCGKFALWQGTGDFHADIHKIYILAGGGAGHVAFVRSVAAQY